MYFKNGKFFAESLDNVLISRGTIPSPARSCSPHPGTYRSSSFSSRPFDVASSRSTLTRSSSKYRDFAEFFLQFVKAGSKYAKWRFLRGIQCLERLRHEWLRWRGEFYRTAFSYLCLNMYFWLPLNARFPIFKIWPSFLDIEIFIFFAYLDIR